jgi:DNA ligase-associated metallophosphoesterase
VNARSFAVELGGASFDVLPGRALFWRARRILVVADVHIGKAATFRALGVPVPRGTTTGNLERLSELIAEVDPATVVFLGDLLHAREALAPRAVASLEAWRARHAEVAMVLVEGNHDAKAGELPAVLNIERVDEPWRLDGIAFHHHPVCADGAVALAGHMHPMVVLRGRADALARLPCFWLRHRLAILPAFGDFTGGAQITREPGDRVIAIADDRLFEIPSVRAA